MRLMNRAGRQCPPPDPAANCFVGSAFQVLLLWANIVPIFFSYSAKEPEANFPLLAAIDLVGKHSADVAFSHHLNMAEEEDTLTCSR